MSKNKKVLINIIKLSMIAAIYVVLTVLIAPLSYGDIQFRFSEVLLILVIFDKKYSLSLVTGCFIANLFSPLLPWDLIFGTLQTVVAVLILSFIKKTWLSFVLCTISMIIIGLEISIVFDLPVFLTTIQVMAGEAAVLFIIGLPLTSILKKSENFMEFIKLD